MSTTNTVDAPGSESVDWLQRLSHLRIPSPALFTVLLIAAIFLLRLPSILFAHELNPDESQMLSNAMKYLVDPVPWRSVDGASNGPLDSYFLSFALLLGWKPGYVLVHALASALVCVQSVAVYGILLRVGSAKAAAWGVLPIVLFFCLTGSNDFIHYSSELVPAACLASGFYCFAIWVDRRRARGPSLQMLLLFLCGALWGAAPWAKLQSGPISGALGLLAVVAIVGGASQPVASVFQKVAQLFAFCLGALSPSAVLLAVVARGGALRDFWTSYVLGNLAYAGSKPWTETLVNGSRALFSVGLGGPFLIGLLALGILVYARRAGHDLGVSSYERWVGAGLLLYSGVGLYCVVKPPLYVLHYCVFLIFPVACLVSWLVSRALPIFRSKPEWRRNFPVPMMAGIGVIVAYYLLNAALYVLFAALTLPEVFRPQMDLNDRLGAVIGKTRPSHPVRSLAIWGWAPGVYVLTGLPPAVRDVCNQAGVRTQPELLGYYRHRFVSDMRGVLPDLFIDAVAPGQILWNWKESDGYESNPELKSYIDENYVLVDQLALVPGAKPVRFFARRENADVRQQATTHHP